MTTDQDTKAIKKAIFWEYAAYYCGAVIIENVLGQYLGDSAIILSLLATVLLIYLVNKAIELKQFSFNQAFQFTLWMSTFAGFIAGIVQAIMRYTISKDVYNDAYIELEKAYTEIGVEKNITDQVFNILTNPVSIVIFSIIAGLIFGAIVGLIMGWIAKSKQDAVEENS